MGYYTPKLYFNGWRAINKANYKNYKKMKIPVPSPAVLEQTLGDRAIA
jgi:hypothetical protein